jgi:hypothetical protein
LTAFRAFRVFDEGGAVGGRVVSATLEGLSPGDVVIKAAYSSVNYKDALAATGTGKIVRRFPLIAGIDESGTVESSADARFAAARDYQVTALTGKDGEHDYLRSLGAANVLFPSRSRPRHPSTRESHVGGGGRRGRRRHVVVADHDDDV